MSLGNIFIRSIVREVGRNYGKAISNGLLGSSHSTPVSVSSTSKLGNGSGGRNYKHELQKICKTWTIKGPTATFNVAQNMYKAFFDLVEDAQADKNINVLEVLELMEAFVEMRPQLIKVGIALDQLDAKELSQKVDELHESLFEFFIELNEGFVLPAEPTGWFKSKQKKIWSANKSVKDNLQKWVDAYNNS